MYWIINKNIEFWPESKRLTSVNNPALGVTLTAPASHCLTLLLEAAPDLVSQQVFFKKVWEDEGILVPANTLYQNISIIRRGLRDVGETDETLVVTVPRKGFHINASVDVEKCQKQALNAGHTLDPEVPAQDVEPDFTASADSVNVIPTTDKKTYLTRVSTFIVMALALLAGFQLTHYIWHFHNETPFFSDYALVAQENGCNFYIKDENHTSDDRFNRYKSLVINSGLNCKRYPYVYFSPPQISPTFIAFICRKSYMVKDSAGCVTLSFRGLTHE